MSVVSSCTTTVSALLKTSGFRAKQLERRSMVTFVPPQQLKKILLNYEIRSDKKTYEKLVCMMRDANIPDLDLINFLNEVRQCISLLGTSHKLFVEALLNIPWLDRPTDVTTAYKAFLEDLICVHIYHCKIVMEKLVSYFKPAEKSDNGEPQEWENGVPPESVVRRLNHIHSCLKKFLKIVPMSSNILLQTISSKFPYYRASAHAHEIYIYSLLQMTQYAPEIQQEILSLVVNRLSVLDVHAPRVELENYGDDDDDDDKEDEEMFKMEEQDEVKKEVTQKFHPIGHTLDICMDMLFNFIHECCYKDGTLYPEGVKKIYYDLLYIFEKHILTTYDSHHIQFIYFYLCSFQSSISQAFINWLWATLNNPNLAPATRQSAVCYLASLIARGSFISLATITAVIEEMSNWIHSYISSQDSLECANSDVRSHTVFYSVCQGLFYVIAFRHKALTDGKKNLLFLQSLNLTKMVTCKLNPLRMCLPVVVQNFAAVTRAYQLAYCYTVMEHNARSNLPVLHSSDRLTTWLETFFPFDPYILPKSYEKIRPIYLEYQGNINIDVKDEKIKQDEEEENDEDDFMDISQTEAKNNVDNQMFSYSTSPGFIHS